MGQTKYFLFIFFCLFFYEGKIQADVPKDCSSLRLDAPGESMERVPVRDQGLMGICYAQTAATMADAWLDTHLTQEHKTLHPFEPSSALELAINSYRYNTPKTVFQPSRNNGMYPFEGGTVTEVFRYIQEKGTCSEEKIPEKNLLQKRRGDFLSNLENIYKNLRATIKDDFYTGKRDLSNNERKEALKNYQETLYCLHQSEIKIGPVFKEMDKIIDVVRSDDFINFSGKIFGLICKDREMLPPFQLRDELVMFKETSRRIFQKAWGSEVKDKQPIGIAFCSKVLNNGSYQGRKDETLIHSDDLKNDCGKHAAVLIGRQYNSQTKSCEYLVQNSWGTNCDMYDTNLKCEHGKVWINQAQLDDNLYRMSYLEGK